ncbi:hypothetical protein [Falsiroseomonas oryzae]|uniref:hypothetical protein n=1 Tax=Falsiroseomonas oryzae TaxID=2766473 RepID=UPI0022EAC47F|nr:hypothetical protein [Roseomonas sp. MO-31]
MPIYMEYEGIRGQLKAEGQAPTAGANDPEYKYVNVRRMSEAEEGEDGAASETTGGVSVAAGDVIGDGAAPVALNHGVTVLAWARVDGQGDVSGDGKSDIVVGTGGGPHVRNRDGDDHGDLTIAQSATVGKDQIHIESFSWGVSQLGTVGEDVLVGGATSHDTPYEATFRGGISVGASNVDSGDDVVVDGRIITGEEFEFGFGDGIVRFATNSVDLF